MAQQNWCGCAQETHFLFGHDGPKPSGLGDVGFQTWGTAIWVCILIGGPPSSTPWKKENRPKLIGPGCLPMKRHTHIPRKALMYQPLYRGRFSLTWSNRYVLWMVWLQHAATFCFQSCGCVWTVWMND